MLEQSVPRGTRCGVARQVRQPVAPALHRRAETAFPARHAAPADTARARAPEKSVALQVRQTVLSRVFGPVNPLPGRARSRTIAHKCAFNAHPTRTKVYPDRTIAHPALARRSLLIPVQPR